VAVTVLAQSRKDAAALVRKVKGTSVARVVLFVRILSHELLTNALVREIRESPTRVVLVAVPTDNPQPAIEAIRLLCASTAGVPVVACGPLVSPTTVVAAIRAGARDFIEQAASTKELNELIVRLLGTDDPDTDTTSPPPDSGPPDSSLPPTVLVGVPRPRAPRTLPSRMATPDG
jgi:DNA-binding NarL/FixJ family response regulator